ncbi:MAG: 16S rRNA (guanine(966)-N(2))-methyltransferase RsmD [Actinomycetota bacterium]|nr:16S rRNA (guanine(966)-N(2))-methyltransferase RsmD [Actinomycetota bacterium]
MRVVAGTARGRRLITPAGRQVRPTSERVREALFNALGSMGGVDGLTVLDVFAGSGALGIEALSRGAASATFVERDRAALGAVRDNLRTCGFADRATVVAGDATSHPVVEQRADLVLCDPPYGFDDWATLLARLDADLVVVETDRELDVPERFRLLRRKRYGSTVVDVFAVTRGADDEHGPDPAAGRGDGGG